MKEYNVKGSLVEIVLDNEKVVKVSKKWVDTTMEKLDTDMEDVLLMYLEDNDYMVNEEQQELNNEAKGKVKVTAKDTTKKKTQRERVVKENPTKERIIAEIARFMATLDGVTAINIENKAKLITFTLNNEDFKLDLVQKRKKKEEKE